MTLDQAIDRLLALSRQPWMASFLSFLAAIKLGIEALNRLKDMRTSPCTTADEVLPGETKS